MKRIAIIAAAATLAAPAAFAEAHMDAGANDLDTRVNAALADCQISLTDMESMDLTVAQANGIVMAANSAGDMNENEKCATMESLLNAE